MHDAQKYRSREELRKDTVVQAEQSSVNNVLPFPSSFQKSKNKQKNDFENSFRVLVEEAPQSKKTTFEIERDHLMSEMIFLKNRDASLQHSSERMEACDLISDDMFPLEKILAATDPDENEALYDQLTTLRTIYINQLITLSYQPDKGIEEQRGISDIEWKRFLLRKVSLCYRKGQKLNKKNYDDLFLNDIELRLDKIHQDIRQLLKEAFEIGAHAPETLSNFKKQVNELTQQTEERIQLPTKAPETYKNRENKGEKPDEFILRVYSKWLGKGLLRPHVKALDEPLYRALYKHGIPKSFENILPKAAGKTCIQRSVTSEEALEQRRANDRARSKRLYQKRKNEAALRK